MTSVESVPGAGGIARRYAGIEDLPLLMRFASRSTAERSPLFACWHPGDVVWELHGAADRPQPNRLYFGPDRVEALAWIVGPGQLWVEALPQAQGRIAEALGWAEARFRARPDQGGGSLSVRALVSDKARIAILEGLGLSRSGPEGVVFRLDLSDPLPAADPPEGFIVRDCVGLDPAWRASAHRDAWNHLEHLGIEAKSRFTTEAYLRLRSLPGYDPTLDIVVQAPSGEPAANCIAWADQESRVGIFEPVGTSLPFRGRRLARVAIAEALRRLKARGTREARVGTAHFNAAAIAAYLACGFEVADRWYWWSKPPGPPA